MEKIVLFTFIAATTLACSDATNTPEDQPLDPEFGLVDGKADAFVVTQGSAEGNAVLAYVNRQLDDQNDADAFFTDLDAELHKTAAKNIVKFRLGPDNNAGTADDREFETIPEVDQIKYVGRVALMGLLELAIDAGLYNYPQTLCSDSMGFRPGSNVAIQNLADMVEVEQTRCNIFDANLNITLDRVDILPPNARTFKAFRHITRIEGALNINVSGSVLDEVNFAALEEVTGRLMVDNIDVNSALPANFPELKAAQRVQITDMGALDLNQLESTDALWLDPTIKVIRGFDALKEVKGETRLITGRGPNTIDLPELKTTGNLILTGGIDVVLSGGIPKLESATAVNIQSLDASNFSLAKLTDVNGTVFLNRVTSPYNPFSRLANVTGDFTVQDCEFDQDLHTGMDSLKTIGNSMKIKDHSGAFDAFDGLETVEGNITLDLRCGGEQSTGFGLLESVNQIVYRTNSCEAGGFDTLKSTRGMITATGGNLPFTAFPQLEDAGGHVNFTTALAEDVFPKLELIDGHLTIQGSSTISGFESLEIIEGTLKLGNSQVSNIDGLSNVTGIAGNIIFPRSLSATKRDDFLNQLTEFTGSISVQ